ncbi:hypothetical protein TGAMA5MH_04635 [Trichoderma gamsii]|uniref:Uncharacterized protein n=1 Tax=Trichoderma gamsii TaxID=398673 RepID=A0A2K0TDR7_9HYPO|nr:hypothetical protein TGAMA5MH_04635 [Trichoderma gamsii]
MRAHTVQDGSIGRIFLADIWLFTDHNSTKALGKDALCKLVQCASQRRQNAAIKGLVKDVDLKTYIASIQYLGREDASEIVLPPPMMPVPTMKLIYHATTA